MGIALTKANVREDLDKLQAELRGKLQDVASKLNQELHALENTTVNIAITGHSGVGKSSLVNALRGMGDFDKNSAETGVTETTIDVQRYIHPSFPNVIIWDLPGIGTPNFKAEEYLKKVKFERYDFFIIVAGGRFTEVDVKLAGEIKNMEKNFYYVRTKLDEATDSERRNPKFNEQETLSKIRNYCCANLVKAGEPSPRVFLISNHHLDKYDFPFLQKTFVTDLDALKKKVLIMALPAFSEEVTNQKKAAMKDLILKMASASCAIGVSPIPDLSLACDMANLIKELDKLQAELQQGNIPDVASKLKQELHALENTTVNIAITGQTAVGKSSLVNALRGMGDYDEDSAKTGVTETTMDAQRYIHPNFPKVIIWDLPGIGTPNFKAEEYLKKVKFERYDFFIIVARGRFTELDVKLTREIKKMKKNFYYVRTNVDQATECERRNPKFNEQEILSKIRNYCYENLVKAGEPSPRVFLISNYLLDKYDFPLLQETLARELGALRGKF